MPGDTFTFRNKGKFAWSCTLDTTTMMIQTHCGRKYKDVYYNGGGSMKPYAWPGEDVYNMDFSDISFPNVDYYHDNYYMRVFVKVYGKYQCVYFKRVD